MRMMSGSPCPSSLRLTTAVRKGGPVAHRIIAAPITRNTCEQSLLATAIVLIVHRREHGNPGECPAMDDEPARSWDMRRAYRRTGTAVLRVRDSSALRL